MKAHRIAIAFVFSAVIGFPRAEAAPRPAQDAPGPAPTHPALGDVFMPFEATGIDGKANWIGFEKGSKTILLFFLSGCPTCHKMIPEWNRAYEQKAPGLTILGVLMDQEPPGFFLTIPISFPVVRAPGRAFLQNLKVNRAPLTIRLAAGGKVEDLGLGLLDPIRLGELFRPPKP